jgi:hypothetical protein
MTFLGLNATHPDDAKKYTVAGVHGLKGLGTHTEVPPEFDGRKTWGDLLPAVRNQGHCGMCWAVASTAVLESRINVLADRSSALFRPVRLSVGATFQCAWDQNEQNNLFASDNRAYVLAHRGPADVEKQCAVGRTAIQAMEHTFRFGVPSQECVKDMPDLTERCEDLTGPGFNTCAEDPGVALFNYTSVATYVVPPESVKLDLLKFGPLGLGMYVDKSFTSYTSDVFDSPGASQNKIGHMVVVVGYREDPEMGLLYKIQNSWGTGWKDGGFGWISARSLQHDTLFVGLIPEIGSLGRSVVCRRIREASANEADTDRTMHARYEDVYPLSSYDDIASGALKIPDKTVYVPSIDIDRGWAMDNGVAGGWIDIAKGKGGKGVPVWVLLLAATVCGAVLGFILTRVITKKK